MNKRLYRCIGSVKNAIVRAFVKQATMSPEPPLRNRHPELR